MAHAFATIQPDAGPPAERPDEPGVTIAVDPVTNSLIVLGSPRIADRLAQLAAGTTVLLDALRTAETSALLESHGLSVSRRLLRMTLDRADAVLMGERVRAITSFEWG